MKIRPLYDRIIVRRIAEDTTSAGGIIIPDSAAEKPQQGEIVAVGRGRLLKNGDLAALQVKVGDRVLFGKFSGSEIKFEGEELLVVQESDLLGTLD